MLGPQVSEFLLHPHPREQLAGMKRLGHGIHSPQPEPLVPCFPLRKCADHQDGDVLAFLPRLQPPEDLKPIHARHPDIEQNEVGQTVRNCSQRMLSAVGLQHLVAGRGQHMAQ